MAHEIFGNRFVGLREPAWHGLGHVVDTPMSAVDALQLMGGYQVVSVPVPAPAQYPDMVVPFKHIYRQATETEPATSFGVVGSDYVLITPQEFAELWDTNVPDAPIETIGALRDGRIMFVTTRLPAFDVKGDAVDNFMIATNGMDGNRAATITVAPVRVVCMNTLRLSDAMSSEMYRLVHNQDVKKNLGEWLQTVKDKAERQAAIIKEAFDVLANARATTKTAERVINAAYPDVKAPARNAPDSVMERRMTQWQAEQDITLRRRDAALDLFNGAGTGMDSLAAKGTLWGVWNAIVETEDRRKGRPGPDQDANIAFETLFGLRAKAKERGFTAAMAVATGKR